MEKLIRLMTNGRTYHEQTNLMENMSEFAEYVGVMLACMTILSFMAIF